VSAVVGQGANAYNAAGRRRVPVWRKSATTVVQAVELAQTCPRAVVVRVVVGDDYLSAVRWAGTDEHRPVARARRVLRSLRGRALPLGPIRPAGLRETPREKQYRETGLPGEPRAGVRVAAVGGSRHVLMTRSSSCVTSPRTVRGATSHRDRLASSNGMRSAGGTYLAAVLAIAAPSSPYATGSPATFESVASPIWRAVRRSTAVRLAT
jgi:hypothetical protein